MDVLAVAEFDVEGAFGFGAGERHPVDVERIVVVSARCGRKPEPQELAHPGVTDRRHHLLSGDRRRAGLITVASASLLVRDAP